MWQLLYLNVCVLRSAAHMKWCLSGQTLVDDSAYAPQISLGIVVLGHDDLRCLCPDKHSLHLGATVTCHFVGIGNQKDFNTHHVHGRATQRCCHSVCLEVTCKPKISWGMRKVQWRTCGTVVCVCVYLCALRSAKMFSTTTCTDKINYI